MIRILLVDDHPMITEGIKSLLSLADNIIIVGCAHDAGTATGFLAQELVDVMLLDVNLPGVDGIEFCRKVTAAYASIKILGISSFKERSYISRMIESGATGYVLKSVSRDELIEAIHSVYAGKIYLNKEITEILVKSERDANPKITPFLTRRENEVLACIAEGLTNPKIAEKLFVSPLTIDSHRKNLLAKFEVKNTASLIKIAVENGLIP
jgi:DNA-binding NarL/FixJ family response regulator